MGDNPQIPAISPGQNMAEGAINTAPKVDSIPNVVSEGQNDPEPHEDVPQEIVAATAIAFLEEADPTKPVDSQVTKEDLVEAKRNPGGIFRKIFHTAYKIHNTVDDAIEHLWESAEKHSNTVYNLRQWLKTPTGKIAKMAASTAFGVGMGAIGGWGLLYSGFKVYSSFARINREAEESGNNFIDVIGKTLSTKEGRLGVVAGALPAVLSGFVIPGVLGVTPIFNSIGGLATLARMGISTGASMGVGALTGRVSENMLMSQSRAELTKATASSQGNLEAIKETTLASIYEETVIRGKTVKHINQENLKNYALSAAIDFESQDNLTILKSSGVQEHEIAELISVLRGDNNRLLTRSEINALETILLLQEMEKRELDIETLRGAHKLSASSMGRLMQFQQSTQLGASIAQALFFAGRVANSDTFRRMFTTQRAEAKGLEDIQRKQTLGRETSSKYDAKQTLPGHIESTTQSSDASSTGMTTAEFEQQIDTTPLENEIKLATAEIDPDGSCQHAIFRDNEGKVWLGVDIDSTVEDGGFNAGLKNTDVDIVIPITGEANGSNLKLGDMDRATATNLNGEVRLFALEDVFTDDFQADHGISYNDLDNSGKAGVLSRYSLEEVNLGDTTSSIGGNFTHFITFADEGVARRGLIATNTSGERAVITISQFASAINLDPSLIENIDVNTGSTIEINLAGDNKIIIDNGKYTLERKITMYSRDQIEPAFDRVLSTRGEEKGVTLYGTRLETMRTDFDYLTTHLGDNPSMEDAKSFLSRELAVLTSPDLDPNGDGIRDIMTGVIGGEHGRIQDLAREEIVKQGIGHIKGSTDNNGSALITQILMRRVIAEVTSDPTINGDFSKVDQGMVASIIEEQINYMRGLGIDEDIFTQAVSTTSGTTIETTTLTTHFEKLVNSGSLAYQTPPSYLSSISTGKSDISSVFNAIFTSAPISIEPPASTPVAESTPPPTPVASTSTPTPTTTPLPTPVVPTATPTPGPVLTETVTATATAISATPTLTSTAQVIDGKSTEGAFIDLPTDFNSVTTTEDILEFDPRDTIIAYDADGDGTGGEKEDHVLIANWLQRIFRTDEELTSHYDLSHVIKTNAWGKVTRVELTNLTDTELAHIRDIAISLDPKEDPNSFLGLDEIGWANTLHYIRSSAEIADFFGIESGLKLIPRSPSEIGLLIQTAGLDSDAEEQLDFPYLSRDKETIFNRTSVLIASAKALGISRFDGLISTLGEIRAAVMGLPNSRLFVHGLFGEDISTKPIYDAELQDLASRYSPEGGKAFVGYLHDLQDIPVDTETFRLALLSNDADTVLANDTSAVSIIQAVLDTKGELIIDVHAWEELAKTQGLNPATSSTPGNPSLIDFFERLKQAVTDPKSRQEILAGQVNDDTRKTLGFSTWGDFLGLLDEADKLNWLDDDGQVKNLDELTEHVEAFDEFVRDLDPAIFAGEPAVQKYIQEAQRNPLSIEDVIAFRDQLESIIKSAGYQGISTEAYDFYFNKTEFTPKTAEALVRRYDLWNDRSILERLMNVTYSLLRNPLGDPDFFDGRILSLGSTMSILLLLRIAQYNIKKLRARTLTFREHGEVKKSSNTNENRNANARDKLIQGAIGTSGKSSNPTQVSTSAPVTESAPTVQGQEKPAPNVRWIKTSEET